MDVGGDGSGKLGSQRRASTLKGVTYTRVLGDEKPMEFTGTAEEFFEFDPQGEGKDHVPGTVLQSTEATTCVVFHSAPILRNPQILRTASMLGLLGALGKSTFTE